MDTANALRTARHDRHLTVTSLAELAGTSQPTLTAYEQGRVTPGVATLDRILHAAGYAADIRLTARQRHGPTPEVTRGDELIAVLELAAEFPASHAPTLAYPVFGARR
jgi:transcriptional regulator with XRE-family HTH domain